MMESRIPFSTVYFCGNCEEEVVGMPAGARVASGRPLCLRCTQIGEQEGWAAANKPSSDTRVYETTGSRGIILILVMMLLAGVAIFVLNALSDGDGKR
jgi:hypothetical protein